MSPHPELAVCSDEYARSDLPLGMNTCKHNGWNRFCGDCEMFNRAGRPYQEEEWVVMTEDEKKSLYFKKKNVRPDWLIGLKFKPIPLSVRDSYHKGSRLNLHSTLLERQEDFAKTFGNCRYWIDVLYLHLDPPQDVARETGSAWLAARAGGADIADDLEHEITCDFLRKIFGILVEGRTAESVRVEPSHNKMFDLYQRKGETWRDVQLRRVEAVEPEDERELVPIWEQQVWGSERRGEWCTQNRTLLSSFFQDEVSHQMTQEDGVDVLLWRLGQIESLGFDVTLGMPAKILLPVREGIHDALQMKSTCCCHAFRNPQKYKDPLRRVFLQIHNCPTECGRGNCLHRRGSGRVEKDGRINPHLVKNSPTYISSNGNTALRSGVRPYTGRKDRMRGDVSHISRQIDVMDVQFTEQYQAAFGLGMVPDNGMRCLKGYKDSSSLPLNGDPTSFGEGCLRISESRHFSQRKSAGVCHGHMGEPWKDIPVYDDVRIDTDSGLHDGKHILCDARHLVGCDCFGCDKTSFIRHSFTGLLASQKNVDLPDVIWDIIFAFCCDENPRGFRCECQNDTEARRFVPLDIPMLLECYSSLHSEMKTLSVENFQKSTVDFYEREMRRFGFSKIPDTRCENPEAGRFKDQDEDEDVGEYLTDSNKSLAEMWREINEDFKVVTKGMNDGDFRYAWDGAAIPTYYKKCPESSDHVDDGYRCIRDHLRPCFLQETIQCDCKSCKTRKSLVEVIRDLDPAKWMMRPPCECSCIVCLVREDCTLRLEKRVPGTMMDVGRRVPILPVDQDELIRTPRNTCNMYHRAPDASPSYDSDRSYGFYYDDDAEEHYDDRDDY